MLTGTKRGKLLIQIALLVGSIFVVWASIQSAQSNLQALGITNGFAFLDRATGWGYSFSFLPRSIDDTYSRTLLIGLLNTLFVGFISIILSTIFGFLIGSVRGSSKPALQTLASIYVQIFRNIPLLFNCLIGIS